MIISPEKVEDMETRALMLDAMEICLRVGKINEAKGIGEASQKMKQKIDTFDYSKSSLIRIREKINKKS